MDRNIGFSCFNGLIGGIDHIEVTRNQVKIHDRGCNGKYRDICIRKDRYRYDRLFGSVNCWGNNDDWVKGDFCYFHNSNHLEVY